jgi:AraC-like DNA-binding protein
MGKIGSVLGGQVAYELNFYDRSHFICEIKAFSGLTPKGITQIVDDFHLDLVGSSYMYG